MVYFIFLLVAFLASLAGSICGIGGGVITKPLLDAFGILDVKTISFLSGCTVLAMSLYSVIKGFLSHSSLVDLKTGIPISIGAAAGGIIGKSLFQILISKTGDQDKVGMIQAIALLMITVLTLIGTLKQNKIRTYHIKNMFVCCIIGMLLGILSAFLGIGGGPMNLFVLYFFFSMSTKVAAQNSLYIILFSQIASLGNSIITKSIPKFSIFLLVLMIIGGILGGMAGHNVNKKVKEQQVVKLFIMLMIIIIGINIYNIYKFMI